MTPDIYGVTEKKGVPVVGSRKVAEIFNKRHDHVLRDISRITDPNSGVSKEFSFLNFEESSYKDSTGRKLPESIMTKDGFTLLAMGFTGKRAMRFKEAYIKRFNQMEQFIKSLHAAKLEFPAFTEAIMLAHEEPKNYHFSNEINMINRIVLGMNAKQFKKANGIDPKVSSIRPYLSLAQIASIERLQRVDIGLQITTPNFHERKQILTDYYHRSNKLAIA